MILQEIEREEAEKICQLDRSNRELREALQIEDDVDFREAIIENEEVMERKRGHLDNIRAKIQELKGADAQGVASPLRVQVSLGAQRPLESATPAAPAASPTEVLPDGLDL